MPAYKNFSNLDVWDPTNNSTDKMVQPDSPYLIPTDGYNPPIRIVDYATDMTQIQKVVGGTTYYKDITYPGNDILFSAWHT